MSHELEVRVFLEISDPNFFKIPAELGTRCGVRRSPAGALWRGCVLRAHFGLGWNRRASCPKSPVTFERN
jgi:hypothetical protein